MAIFLANIILKNLDTKLNGLKVIIKTTKIGQTLLAQLKHKFFNPIWGEACF
jgi:hypothetical protein